MNKSSAFLLAASAMALTSFAFVAPVAVAAAADVGHCVGINTCKGTSDCKTAESACKGQNVCKGHGFKALTEKECTAAKGKFEAVKK